MRYLAGFNGLMCVASWRLLLCAAGLAVCAPAWSADQPSLKETLGKVQSEAEVKAVEDLISKLKGVSRVPTPTTAPLPTVAPSLPGGAPGVSPSLVQPPQAPPPTAPLSPKPDQVASPALPEASPSPPVVEPEEAIKRAAQSQAPSIDLEVFFGYNSAEITREAAAALMPVGGALSDARLSGDSFLIAGHSDAKGGADFNLALSQKRAEAVRTFLIDTFGIDGKKLVATGMGAKHLKNIKQPLAAENRRVQIVNLSKDQGTQR